MRSDPVWIVGFPVNKSGSERLWNERRLDDHLTRITTFLDADPLSPQDSFLGLLDTVDLHRGDPFCPKSHPPDYKGSALGEHCIQTELANFGSNELNSNSNGFSASRSLPVET